MASIYKRKRTKLENLHTITSYLAGVEDLEYIIALISQSISLHSGQVAHQAGAYPGFCSMKRLRVFLLPPGWDASPSQG